MVPSNDKWIRIFDIPDVSKHKQGFTIYKIVSLLYPENCPDAVIKVTVWKRFNDFKKLHHELKILHRKYNHKTKFPSLPTRTLFKRFNEQTIAERKRGIQFFLEYIGSNQQLFTSNEFVKFLETSHTPAEHLVSNINNIRADLHLPEDPEVCTNLSFNSEDDRTISDSDSISTMSSLSPSVQNDTLTDSLINGTAQKSRMKKLNSSLSINSQSSSKNSDSQSISTVLDSIVLLDDQIYPTPPNTPRPTVMSDQQYIIDASVHIRLAVELEGDKKYEEAFCAYKTAIDILLKHGKDDPNYERRQTIRYKTEKYLIKAEKIYNMYLAPEVKDLKLECDNAAEEQEPTNAKRPLFDLYKYKVVKIISNGMLVLHSESQELFYIKVIHKTVQFLKDNLILPENVPYMVKLYNYYNCENALFLVLEYCSGTNLRDYLKKHSMNTITGRKDSQILQQIQDLSDNDSELSYSELVNDYVINRSKEVNVDVEKDNSSDDSYEKVDMSDLQLNRTQNIMDKPLTQCDVEDLLTKSQNLLSSVDSTLTEKITIPGHTKGRSKDEDNMDALIGRDISSDRENQRGSVSLATEDFDTNLVLPEETVVKWAAQLLLALDKLHTLGVVCRHLQMKNLMVNEKGDLVLTYVCNVREVGDLYCDRMDHNLAPEVYSYQDITPAADWWSYGAILYELLVGMPLSDIYTSGINSFSHLKIPKYVSAEGRSLIKQLLVYEPHNRLGSSTNGTENIKSHPFFSNISWDSLLSTFHSSTVNNADV